MSTSIIITGSSSGIGRAVALRLAHWDGVQILTGRSRERLEKTKTQVEEEGGKAVIFPCDLSESSAVEDLVAFAETHAPVYAVVLSAGTGTYGKIEDQPPSEWSRMIEVNLMGLYYLVYSALRRMVNRKKGHFVFINSVAGLKSFPGNSAYASAKHGARGLAETLRLEARNHNIKVTSIFPGATDTEWWDKQDGEFPRERMLRAEDVAATVDFSLTFGARGVIEEIVLRDLGGDF
ncbi:SDR family oxidoreductase [Candidatus Neomarinimicrobiota bacterium]